MARMSSSLVAPYGHCIAVLRLLSEPLFTLLLFVNQPYYKGIIKVYNVDSSTYKHKFLLNLY